jgi:lipopolysaccharide export system permease protein
MAAPRILWRFVFRDVAVYALIALAALTLLLVVQNVLRFIDELVSAGVSLEALVQLSAIILPSYVAYAIPSALLFGVLLSFGRMSTDGEIIAMRASGVSVTRLLPPVLALGVLATCATGYVVFEVEPESHRNMKLLLRQLQQSVRLIEPGEFRRLGSSTIYVHELGGEACPLQGVLISDARDARRTLYIAARCGTVHEVEAETAQLALGLHDGSVHFSDPGAERYRRIRFDELETRLDLERYFRPRRKARDYRFAELLDLRARLASGEQVKISGGVDPQTQVQLQIHRKLAFPIASIALALLAVPMGIRPVRAGRSWGTLTAIGVLAAYWIAFGVAEIAVSAELVPVVPAMWAPNLAVIALAIFLIRRSMHADS